MTENPYAAFVREPSEDILKSLSRACAELEEADAEVDRLTAELKVATKRATGLAEERIPELMDEAGGQELLKLSGGRRVELKRSYHGNINAGNREVAHEWLRANKHGSIIRNDILLRFGKGEEKMAGSAYATLLPFGERVERKEWVHHSTLNAFVKERLESGVELPESFGAHVRRRASITSK